MSALFLDSHPNYLQRVLGNISQERLFWPMTHWESQLQYHKLTSSDKKAPLQTKNLKLVRGKVASRLGHQNR